jgi:hypothetical protein
MYLLVVHGHSYNVYPLFLSLRSIQWPPACPVHTKACITLCVTCYVTPSNTCLSLPSSRINNPASWDVTKSLITMREERHCAQLTSLQAELAEGKKSVRAVLHAQRNSVKQSACMARREIVRGRLTAQNVQDDVAPDCTVKALYEFHQPS